jgi:hypothetical protein
MDGIDGKADNRIVYINKDFRKRLPEVFAGAMD